MKLRLPLALILALQPLAAETFTIDGSSFPDAKTVTIQSSTTAPDTTYCLHSNIPSGSFNLYYNYDVAALYTDKNSETGFTIMDPVLTAEKGAIYLSNALFLTSGTATSGCVFTTVQKTSDAYGTTYGTPQIIIEDSAIMDTYAITLNTASATLRNIRLRSQATVNVNEGALTIAGLYSDDSQSATMTADKGIYLNNGTSYKYTGINSLSLSSAGTITIGETTTTIGETPHTLSGISSLTLDYTGNGGGNGVWDVNIISEVESNVTITASSGRVQAGILKGKGSSSITAQQLYLSTFYGGSLTSVTTDHTEVKGELTATGDLDLKSSNQTLYLGGSATADNQLKLSAATTLTGAASAAYRAASTTLKARDINMSGAFYGNHLSATAEQNMTLGAVGAIGDLFGSALLTTNQGDISVDSFTGESLTIGIVAGDGTITIGDITTATKSGSEEQEEPIELVASGSITVNGSISATSTIGTSSFSSAGGALTINGALTVANVATLKAAEGVIVYGNIKGSSISATSGKGKVLINGFNGTTLSATSGSSLTCQGDMIASGAATLTATGAITVTGAIGTDEDAVGDITLTAGSSSAVSIGSFCGNSLTITQAGAVTINGEFFSTGGKDFYAAQMKCASLEVSGKVTREDKTYGIFKASTTSGSMTFKEVVKPYSLSLDSAEDITFEGDLKPGSLAGLKAKGTITVNGAAVLKSGSTLQANSISFNGGLTATGVTISGAISEATDVTLTDSTLDSLSMSGHLISEGTVTISKQTAEIKTQSLTLKGGTLTLGDHSAYLTTSVLNVEAKTTLNANLVLSSGAAVTLAKGTTIDLGCSLTLSGNTSFTLSEQVTPLHYVTLMTGVDKLYTDGDVWTQDPSNPDIVTTRLSEIINSESGTYTYTTGAKEGSLMLVYNSDTGDFSVTPEPATATLSLLALAALCARRRR